ncbi:MAG: ATP synthase F1 subunit gamma [Lentisphaeria bacterium]|nr:ATP synthase F1 subunit gamma [Lentisphaeria bacterium]NQZ66631.1 ATP synthase F1 subunit gamma [Lentisphaeria bacterium]
MPSLQDYTKKLKSLKNTLKITKTMKMVSASKLRKAQQAQSAAKDYANHINGLIIRLAGALGKSAHPLFEVREKKKTVLILVFTSDKGLCGGFNNNLIKYAEAWLKADGAAFDNVVFSFCGKRGFRHFSGKSTIDKHYEETTGKPNFSDASRIGKEICDEFIDGIYDEVHLAHNIFHNPLSQEPTMEKLLPVEPKDIEEGNDELEGFSRDYIFEPSKDELVMELVPRTVNFKIFYTLLENSAGEHGARMAAMDNATNNAEDMIESNTLLRNRARQSAITTELIEIISGAEALK